MKGEGNIATYNLLNKIIVTFERIGVFFYVKNEKK